MPAVPVRGAAGSARCAVSNLFPEAARRIAVSLLLVIGGVSSACAADGAEEPAAVPQQSIVESAPSASPLAKTRSSRLRFRNGPVCLCADGLSERDIREAAAARNTNSSSSDHPTK